MPRISLFIKLPFILILAIAFLVKCTDSKRGMADPRGSGYAGSVSCRTCHQAVYDSFRHTAHYAATSPADNQHIKDGFSEGQNFFAFDGDQLVKMERRGNKLFQVLYEGGKEQEAHSFDIGFGKNKAQTWLYWNGPNTYQLPVSYYYSVRAWGTSPGFSFLYPSFDRLIGRNCFECHSSNIDYLPGHDTLPDGSAHAVKKEQMNPSSLVMGIDCERCHGPAAEHVLFHDKNPGQSTGHFITRIAGLTRLQQLDACAVCHSGNDRTKLKSRFAFRPGDSLSHYFGSLLDTIIKTETDVHGNQYGLLSQSRCFTKSVQLTCTTCHDPHRDAVSDLAVYSAKCLGCHKEGSPGFCKVTPADGVVLSKNCIDCHMPDQPSAAISFQLSGSAQRVSYLLRTHKIAVY